MLKYHILNPGSLLKYLDLTTNPDHYKVVFRQEAETINLLQRGLSTLPDSTREISLEFKTGHSPELINLFYNENIKNLTLATDRYLINYSYNKLFDILLYSPTTSPKDAAANMIEILERLRVNGLPLGFQDQKHIEEVINLFYDQNFYQISPHKWECNLRQETHIKPGFTWEVITDETGENRSVLAQVNFSLKRIGRIIYPKAVDHYLSPLFHHLNQNGIYRVYIRELQILPPVTLPDTTTVKMGVTINDPERLQIKERQLPPLSTLCFITKGWNQKILYQQLELKCDQNNHQQYYIVFSDEEQRDLLLKHLKKQVIWKLVYEE